MYAYLLALSKEGKAIIFNLVKNDSLNPYFKEKLHVCMVFDKIKT